MREYLGRKYEIGKNDCLSLVCEYYKKELNTIIKVPEYSSANDIHKFTISDVFLDGFKKVPLDKIQSRDILVFTLRDKKTLLHLGVFFAPNKFLHIEKDNYSKYEDISDFFWDRLAVILRGKNV